MTRSGDVPELGPPGLPSRTSYEGVLLLCGMIRVSSLKEVESPRSTSDAHELFEEEHRGGDRLPRSIEDFNPVRNDAERVQVWRECGSVYSSDGVTRQGVRGGE